MATEIALNSERVSQIFTFFETQKTLLTTCIDQWAKLSSQFTTLEQSLHSKSTSIDSKLESLQTQTQKTLETLTQLEESLPERETQLIARVEEQRVQALVEFEKDGASEKVELGESLKSLCRRMDSLGLLRIMTGKRKDAVSLRKEIKLAIVEAVDPYTLVLDVVKVYLERKDAKGGVSDRRWACGTLLSALFPAEENVKVGVAVMVAGRVKERAVGVAEAWKAKVESEEGGSVEAPMLLQMVVVFGLVERFDQEFLRKLVVENSSKRDMPKLANALGFGEKMGDIIDELVKKGKEIDAVYFACECGLTERFEPVDLLKNYLKKSKTQATTILKNNRYSAAATDNAGNVELNSVKSIIKCVEDHNLESKFSLQSLRKRVAQLEKIKADKRKTASTSNKRTRGSGGSTGSSAFRIAKYGRGPDSYSSYGRRNSGPGYQNSAAAAAAAAYSRPYNYPNQSVYKGPPSASYSLQYGAHTRSPAALPQHYSVPPENIGAAGAQVTGSYGAQTNYGSYDYNAVAPSSYRAPYPQ